MAAFQQRVAGTPTQNGNSGKNAELAAMLRECAGYVERGEFDPIMYRALAELHAYSGKHAGSAAMPSTLEGDVLGSSGHSASPQDVSSAFQNVPDNVFDDMRGNDIGGRGVNEKENRDWFASVGKKFSKLGGFSSRAEQERSSAKNAQSIRDALDGLSPPESHPAATPAGTSAASAADAAEQQQDPSANKPKRPCFQRPLNSSSNLIANGWIEQNRRSRMRSVWKDILASLVEGRHAGEETTLWIQREVINTSTGKPELEALHQIPMKWLEDVTYLDFYGDFRFALKVYNVPDEFQFRTRDEESAQNWVLTLRNARDTSLGKKNAGNGNISTANSIDDWDATKTTRSSATPSPSPSPVPDDASSDSGSVGKRMTIKELRAIAHGAGFDTRGMERADLEKIAIHYGYGKKKAADGTQETTPTSTPSSAPSTETERQQKQASARAETARKLQAEAEKKRQHEELRQKEDAHRKKEIRRQEELRRQAEEIERKRQREFAEKQAAEHRRRLEEEHKKRIAEQQAAAAAAAEKKRQEEAAAARAAAEQQKKQEEEQKRQWQQQQWQQWQQKQQQQQQQQAKQNQWQQQQQQFSKPPASNGPAPPPPPQQQYHQQQQQHPNTANNPASPINTKYAKAMNEKSEEAEQLAISRIKREILVKWALLPPMYQMLRPIDQLITSIHGVFPPSFGVPAHAYFSKWKPIGHSDIALSSALSRTPDDEKLKKSVRKIRFFLHPDKLPRDLNAEQEFMCKMLWDVTSDAWEEFCKQKEELDWMK